jgi:hypothetical protein
LFISGKFEMVAIKSAIIGSIAKMVKKLSDAA